MSACFQKPIALLSLVLLSAGTFAAPGFIVGSKIRGGTNVAEITIQFACAVEYVDHFPANESDRVRIQIESTTLCNGVPPTVAYAREQHRPADAEIAKLLEITYDGESETDQALTLAFSETVSFGIEQNGTSSDMVIRVYPNKETQVKQPIPRSTSVRTVQDTAEPSSYVINLSSSQIPHAPSEMQAVSVSAELKVFESEVLLAGSTWYRLRVGTFESTGDAQTELRKLRAQYPAAWIDRAPESTNGEIGNELAESEPLLNDAGDVAAAFATMGLDQIDQLMVDARLAMVAGETSRAIQIYTKVLRGPSSDRHAQAQEYLALAREKNGQKAHARSEYQRYLQLYPDNEGTARVQQRLAALLASERQVVSAPASTPGTATTGRRSVRNPSAWRFQTFFSQYYRRDVNQPNEQADIVSQSALYSDINLDIRRRGQRFDFSSRLSAGYRNDFLDEDQGSGDQARVSYAYADLADAETGLRGRIGRQSRNTGGILGRFDGLNIGYQASERILVNAVAGIPVNSASDSIDSERTFQGLSVNYGPLLDNLELGAYFISQSIEGIEDRTATGAEFRYFGENHNLWGLVDYDTSYSELGSAFLQGSWRVTPRLSVHGSVDRRHTPYLSSRNAMIGQPVQTFAEMLVLYSEAEIHQFSIDRSPLSESYTVGLSQSFSPRLQINFDANQTTIDATPESGGVLAIPESTFRYVATTLVASSLITEGDVLMVSLRASDSNTTKVSSMTLDTRFPLGRSWRVNPRLRVDRRQILSDSSIEWLYTPGLRIQIRNSQRYRIDLEAGKRFSERDSPILNLDRESYFVNLGYQVFF